MPRLALGTPISLAASTSFALPRPNSPCAGANHHLGDDSYVARRSGPGADARQRHACTTTSHSCASGWRRGRRRSRSSAAPRRDPRRFRRLHREGHDAQERARAVAHAGVHRRSGHDLRGRLPDPETAGPGCREDREAAPLRLHRGHRRATCPRSKHGSTVGVHARRDRDDPARVHGAAR